jgi:hypothetical protein
LFPGGRKMSKTVKFLLCLVFLGLLYTPTLVGAAGDADIKITEPSQGVPVNNIGPFISNIINVAIAIAALAAFLMLLWGGFQWITSGGDKTQYEAARNRITYALVGLAIVAAAWAVMQLVGKFFGVSINEWTVPDIREGK